ncbi:MAG: redoxin family protein [Pyrinomonadaceae bacterium]|nr:redoxin family protein [Pyrinomonadaceae bacterium]
MTESKDKEKGAIRADQNELMFGQGFSFSGYERDPLYLNLGTKKFLDISGVSGIDSISDGRSAVFADFDNDGDLDVFLTTIQNEAHLLFRNNVGSEAGSLRIELLGDSEIGRDAFGSVVRIKTSAGILTKIKSGGSGFMSQHDPRLTFGLGNDEGVESIEVTWSNGKKEVFKGRVAAGSTVRLEKGTGVAELFELDKASLPDPLSKAERFAKGLKIAVGEPMPDFPVSLLDGTSVTMKSRYKPGRSTVVNIWATWCSPCAKEMPELEKLSPRLEAAGIDLIGLNVDSEKDADVEGFVKKFGVTYPILVGGVPAIEKIYATDQLTVPISILVDQNGNIKEVLPGWSAETEKRFFELANGG